MANSTSGSSSSLPTFGDRLKQHREAAGMTRPVLAGLLGRSPEWLKAVEGGRLLQPRLPMLIQMARILQIDDLSELTGEQRLSQATYTKAAHKALPVVASALADFSLSDKPSDVASLRGRVRQAWELWHGARHHRTAISVVLPSLLADARTAARRLDGVERREASALLAQVNHLAQLYLSFQPAPDLVMLTGDRAMNAAMDADDPRAMAASAWYMNHVYRDAGQQAEARVSLATQMSALLRPEDRQEDLALWGLLRLAIALSYTRIGREGDAWRHWDEADRAARRLSPGYHHPWLIFGCGMVDAYQVTMHNDLMHGGQAVAAAERLDLASMPSATRRSFHFAETARAYSLKREPVATVHLLYKAFEESPDTARFSLFTRSAVTELSEVGSSTVRADARRLAAKIGIPA